jgi:hypothetical protein
VGLKAVLLSVTSSKSSVKKMAMTGDSGVLIASPPSVRKLPVETEEPRSQVVR